MNTSMPRFSQKFAIGVMIVVALAAGMVVGGMDRDGVTSSGASDAATGLGRYEIGGELDLTNQRGKRVRLGDLAGNAVMLFFRLYLLPRHLPGKPWPACVRSRPPWRRKTPLGSSGCWCRWTPARDTPERLGEYVEFFDPGFIGLTGAEDELQSVARRYGAQFEIPEGQPEDGYLVNHSTFGYLIDPAGQVRALYSVEEPVEGMAANVQAVLDEIG